jgi:enolase
MSAVSSRAPCRFRNGGVHADKPIDIQEFMAMPVGASSRSEAIRIGAEIFHPLRKKLADAGRNTNVGDEGGFVPNLPLADAALGMTTPAIEDAGEEVVLAFDPAASEFYREGAYHLAGGGGTLDAGGLVAHWTDLVRRYPIGSIEDGMAEDDWEGWAQLTRELGGTVQLVGDDVLVTNPARLWDGIARRCQRSARQSQPDRHVVRDPRSCRDRAAGRLGHRFFASGETEDTTIADLPVATNCGQIKTGSLSRSDRLAKYNLIRIEEQLGGRRFTPAVWCCGDSAIQRELRMHLRLRLTAKAAHAPFTR